MKGIRWMLAALIGAAGLAALSADRAAARGGGGGNPPPQVDTGLVYYMDAASGSTYTMLPDGTGKTAFNAVADSDVPTANGTVKGCPSNALHGGVRYWLQWRQVEEQGVTGTYWFTEGGTTHTAPAFPRVELFAISQASGAAYRLTDGAAYFTDTDSSEWLVDLVEADLCWSGSTWGFLDSLPFWSAEWGNDGTSMDAKVSFTGRRWTREVVLDSGGNVVRDGNGDPTFTTWLLTDPGNYVAEVDWASLGSAPATATRIVSKPFVADANRPYRVSCTASWSPDGSKFVFSWAGAGEGMLLKTGNADGSGVATISGASGSMPRWSPVADRIVYMGGSGGVVYEIRCMDPDGSDNVVLVADPPDKTGGKNVFKTVNTPSWSPSGTWVLYKYSEMGGTPYFADWAYRVPADGGTPVQISSGAQPCFWR